MQKYAIINNNKVTDIQSVEEEDYLILAKNNHLVISIEGTSPQPQIGWVLNGNKLEYPQSLSSVEEFEIQLAAKKCEFGTQLAKETINRMGARNKILNKTGAQVIAILNQLVGIKMLLETGALGTARSSCAQLKSIFTEYSDIFDDIINKINSFESTNGL